MSDEAQEQIPAEAAATDASSAPAPEPSSTSAVEEQKKSVSFQKNELTFDEAQAEIDAIKARAGQARESLRTTSSIPSGGSSSLSSYSSMGGYEDDSAKSKNMLSHLNSHSAMLNYKVQAARSLVRKQEDLLRNLARMRENMERSECELYKASDYYSSARHRPYGYFERRAESAPFISRRTQVREPSPSYAAGASLEISDQFSSTSDAAANPVPPSLSYPAAAAGGGDVYQPDEDFEREMAAIRKRVANLSKKANEIPAPRYTSAYDFDSSYLGGYSSDIYSTPTEQRFEVTNTTNHIPKPLSPRPYRHAPPPRTTKHSTSTYTTKHVPTTASAKVITVDDPTYPRSSFTEYVMDSLNDINHQPSSYGSVATNTYGDVYDPFMSGVGDIPLAY